VSSTINGARKVFVHPFPEVSRECSCRAFRTRGRRDGTAVQALRTDLGAKDEVCRFAKQLLDILLGSFPASAAV
jgi:hypothetical protein